MLYKFGKIVSRILFYGRNSNPNTSFSSLYTSKLFVESAKAVIRTGLVTPPITPQSTIFDFTYHKVNNQLINNLKLIFKYYIY